MRRIESRRRRRISAARRARRSAPALAVRARGGRRDRPRRGRQQALRAPGRTLRRHGQGGAPDADRVGGPGRVARAPHRGRQSGTRARRRISHLLRAPRRPGVHADAERECVRAGAQARGGARRDRPRQDRVLQQRQPRVPHAADLDPGSPRGRRRRPGEVSERRRPRDRPSKRAAPPAAGQQPARLLAHRGRPAPVEVRADRPRDADGRTGRLVSLPARVGRAEARHRLPSSPGTCLRRSIALGEDRPQPDLERLQVHLRGRDRRRAAGPRRSRGALRPRHRHRDPGCRSSPGSSSAFIASRERGGGASRGPGSGSRWCRS